MPNLLTFSEVLTAHALSASSVARAADIAERTAFNVAKGEGANQETIGKLLAGLKVRTGKGFVAEIRDGTLYFREQEEAAA